MVYGGLHVARHEGGEQKSLGIRSEANMRDVTDNRTGELSVGEVKRGRGRPRKENALSGAERQAAYRARRKASVSVTVTENGPVLTRRQADQAEASDEYRALKAELAEARKTIDQLNDALRGLRSERDALWRGVEEAQAAHGRADAARAKLERDYNQLEAAANKVAPKSVTGNGNSQGFDLAVQLLHLAMAGKTHRQLMKVVQSATWQNALKPGGLRGDDFKRLSDALWGESYEETLSRGCVPPKAVTV